MGGIRYELRPADLLHGIADAAVRDGWRSAGIARTMGAAAVICDTGALGRVDRV